MDIGDFPLSYLQQAGTSLNSTISVCPVIFSHIAKVRYSASYHIFEYQIVFYTNPM